MRILNFSAKNFGSYKELTIDLSKKNLALIYGSTGAGKSTLLDVPSWCLYGVTSKDGLVDEIKKWNTPDDITSASVAVELQDEVITVTRVRGKPTQNDLYWVEDGLIRRGKDIVDTQRLLEQKLGVSKSLFLMGAYYNEFSESSHFFLGKSKTRREFFEVLTPLELPSKLLAATAESRKQVKRDMLEVNQTSAKCTAVESEISRSLSDSISRSLVWDTQKERTIKTIEEEAKTFETTKLNRVKYLEHKLSYMIKSKEALFERLGQIETSFGQNTPLKCPTCGNFTPSKSHEDEKKKISELIHHSTIKEVSARHDLVSALEKTSNHAELLEFERKKQNPFASQIEDNSRKLAEVKSKLKAVSKQLSKLEHDLVCLDTLYDLSFSLRGILLKRSVSNMEFLTNSCLENYFDSEIRLQMTLEDSDEVQVSLSKGGNPCSYSQLSKGQRGLLKLAFSTSVIKMASDRSPTKLDNLFMDESLDGLDNALKLKAYRLFEDLAMQRSSVLVVDHSEDLKELFSDRIHVVLNNDHSEIRDYEQVSD